MDRVCLESYKPPISVYEVRGDISRWLPGFFRRRKPIPYYSELKSVRSLSVVYDGVQSILLLLSNFMIVTSIVFVFRVWRLLPRCLRSNPSVFFSFWSVLCRLRGFVVFLFIPQPYLVDDIRGRIEATVTLSIEKVFGITFSSNMIVSGVDFSNCNGPVVLVNNFDFSSASRRL